MKHTKILSYLLLAALTLGLAASCVKDREPAFDKKPTVRMQEALKACQEILVAAPNGWAMYQFMNEENTTAIHGGYMVALQFTTTQVTAWGEMCSDPTTSYTSLYKMTTDDGPVLTFDDNNYVLHYYSTPSGTGKNGYGQTGHYQALGGDFEFLILEAKAECVKLKGKRGGQIYYLFPLDKAPATFMQNVVNMRDGFYISSFIAPEKNLSVTLDMENRHILFNHYVPATTDAAAVETKILELPFLYTETGIFTSKTLKKALSGKTVDAALQPVVDNLAGMDIQDFAWNATAQTLAFYDVTMNGNLPDGWMPFDAYAGNYTLTYDNTKSIDVTLEVLESRRSFRMTGMNANYAPVVTYDLASGSLYLYGQTLGEVDGNTVWLCPWWYTSASNSLWRSTKYGMRTQLDEASYAADPAHFVLNWAAGPSVAGKPINSFILYYEKDGASNGRVTNTAWLVNNDYRMYNLLTLTKK